MTNKQKDDLVEKTLGSFSERFTNTANNPTDPDNYIVSYLRQMFLSSTTSDQTDAARATLLQYAEREQDYQRSLENRAHAEAYNDPSQQLARLMATGMSRQSAMAAITGGATVDAASTLSTPTIAGNVEANRVAEQNALLGYLGTGIHNINEVTGIWAQQPQVQAAAAESLARTRSINAQLPMSVSQARSQAQIARNGATMSNFQLQAYNDSALLSQVITNLRSGDVEVPKWSSIGEMFAYMSEIDPNDSNPARAAARMWYDANYKRVVGSPYTFRAIQEDFKDDDFLRGYTSVADRDEYLRRTMLHNVIMQDFDERKVASSIMNITADTDLLKQQLRFNERMNPLQIRQQELDNQLDEFAVVTADMDLETYQDIFDNTKETAMQQALYMCNKWLYMSPDAAKRDADLYMKNLDNMYALAELSLLGSNFDAQFIREHPDLKTWDYMYNQSHVKDLVDGALEAYKGTQLGRIGQGTNMQPPRQNLGQRGATTTKRANSTARDIQHKEGSFYGY